MDYFSALLSGKLEEKMEKLNRNVKWVEIAGKEIEIWFKDSLQK